MSVLLAGRHTNWMLCFLQALITDGEMWDARLSPRSSFFPSSFLRIGRATSKNHISKVGPPNQPLSDEP